MLLYNSDGLVSSTFVRECERSRAVFSSIVGGCREGNLIGCNCDAAYPISCGCGGKVRTGNRIVDCVVDFTGCGIVGKGYIISCNNRNFVNLNIRWIGNLSNIVVAADVTSNGNNIINFILYT